MASIGNSLLSASSSPLATGSSSSAAATAASSGASDPSAALGNETTFLQLLVAQLKNQDPSQPQDGTQFVTQLATFSNLEQSIGMKSDLDSIRSKYTGAAVAAASSDQPKTAAS